MFGFSKKEDTSSSEDTCIEILRVEPGQAREFLEDLRREHDKLIERERQEQGKEERRKK